MFFGTNNRKFMSRFIFVAAIMSCIMIPGVYGVSQGRRRRRNLKNMKSCGKGQRSIFNSYKKIIGCEDCPVNTYRPDETHYREDCILCPAGRIVNKDRSYCIGDICPPGKFGTQGVQGCIDCTAGKYSLIGSYSCTECESGRFNTNHGMDSCMGDMCLGGYYGLTGQTTTKNTHCHLCEKGKWSKAGSEMCQTCPHGKYVGMNGDECFDHKKCPSNSYYTVVPSPTSGKIICSRCIYYNDLTTFAFYFAVVSLSLNTVLFLANFKSYCWVFLFIICSSGWAYWINICVGKIRSETSIIVSICMNFVCLSAIFIAVCKKSKALFHKYKEKQSSHSINTNKHYNDNGCGIVTQTSVV